MNKIDTTCEHSKIRLIAAAQAFQGCTRTDGTETRIPGTNKRILIGDDAYLAMVAAPAAKDGITSIEGLTRYEPALETAYGGVDVAVMSESIEGNYFDAADVERLLATQAQAAEPSGAGEPIYQVRDAHIGAWCDVRKQDYNIAPSDKRRTLYAEPVQREGGAVEPIAYVNCDELDNMLDDRTATIQTNPSGWRKTPLYAHPAVAVEPAVEQAETAIPAGYKLVPLKLTNAMRAASREKIGFTQMYEAAVAAAPSPSAQDDQDVKDAARWSKQPPTEQGEYWNWDGDEDHAPMIYHVLWSGTAKKCFVSMGQYGIDEAIWCDSFGGWWLPIEQPSIRDAAMSQAKGAGKEGAA